MKRPQSLLLLLLTALFIAPIWMTRAAESETESHLTYLPMLVKPRRVIFFDDFSDPRSGWSVGDWGQDRLRYIDGEYEILLRTDNIWSGASAPVDDINDYTVEADMRQYSGNNSGYGIIFEREDWDHFYLFIVFPDVQGYALLRYNLGWETVIPGVVTQSINPGSGTNRLAVKRIGSEITLYINGVEVDSAIDSTFTGSSREVGLYIESGNSAPVAVRYDNFTVWQ